MYEQIRVLFSRCQFLEKIGEDEKFYALAVVFHGLRFNVLVRKSNVFLTVGGAGLAAGILENVDDEDDSFPEFDLVRAFTFDVDYATDFSHVWETCPRSNAMLSQYLLDAVTTSFCEAVKEVLAAEHETRNTNQLKESKE